MTVAELIAELQKLDPGLPVSSWDYDREQFWDLKGGWS